MSQCPNTKFIYHEKTATGGPVLIKIPLGDVLDITSLSRNKLFKRTSGWLPPEQRKPLSPH